MRFHRFLTFGLLALLALLAQALPALEVRLYKNGRSFVTEGGMDKVEWYKAGLSAMADYANYNAWGLSGLDGKDPVSATYWENFKEYIFQPPNTLLLKYTLRLPWPIGIVPSQAKLRIDESQLANDQLTMTLIERPIGVEEMVLSLSATESPTDPSAKMVHFRISVRFDPFVEGLIDIKSLNAHMQMIVTSLASNLEAYSLAHTIQEPPASDSLPTTNPSPTVPPPKP